MPYDRPGASMRAMDRTFDDLIAEAAAAPVDGCDFSWLEGRATQERPSWGYQRLLGERLPRASAALDVETGGGEVLAGVRDLPPLMVATEAAHSSRFLIEARRPYGSAGAEASRA